MGAAMSNDVSERRVAATAFVLIALLVGADVTIDLMEGTALSHALIELFVVACALLGAAVLWRRRSAALAGLRQDLSASKQAARRWRKEAEEAVAGVSEAIDKQFERWDLSAAEREVALLLLKGLSLKETADVRGTSERTVREQARAVYRKGDLCGRAELAAFFLEDLLSPRKP
jgi:DNA-binding CsgD family transcriptional regulator